jgi:hypothetical protein
MCHVIRLKICNYDNSALLHISDTLSLCRYRTYAEHEVEEVTIGLRKLHNEKLHILYVSPDIIEAV